MQLFEPLAGDVGIDLRGGYIGMAEQYLHHAQVRAVVQQVRGEGAARREDAPADSSCARRNAKRVSANSRKIRPSTGAEYCAAVSPELARNWSAAFHRRFSRASLARSYSDGAIQSIRVSCQPVLIEADANTKEKKDMTFCLTLWASDQACATKLEIPARSAPTLIISN